MCMHRFNVIMKHRTLEKAIVCLPSEYSVQINGLHNLIKKCASFSEKCNIRLRYFCCHQFNQLFSVAINSISYLDLSRVHCFINDIKYNRLA